MVEKIAIPPCCKENQQDGTQEIWAYQIVKFNKAH